MSEGDYEKWKSEGVLCRSVGIFMSEDENFINIIGDIDLSSGEKNIGLAINVGKGLVKNTYKLRRVK